MSNENMQANDLDSFGNINLSEDKNTKILKQLWTLAETLSNRAV